MNRGNWNAVRQRSLMRRRGATTSYGVRIAGSADGPKPLRTAPSKERLRAMATEALEAFTGTIQRCPPGDSR
jgi:hypothetical protein